MTDIKCIKRNHSVLCFAVLLILGFLGLCLPGLVHFDWGYGFSAAIWILSFLLLTGLYRSGREMLITCCVFVTGYFLKFIGTMNFEWLYALLFIFIGFIQYSVFFCYSRLIGKWNRFVSTLAFPILWMLVYFLAMLVRLPSLIRVDMMFADMNVLLQSESLLGSFGLSFVLLWIFSLLAFSIINRKLFPAIIGMLLYLAMLIVGIVYLYPNVSDNESVRVALSTGPYVGDYMDYSSLPVERYLSGMRSCVAAAAEQGADIIVFNEETYEFDDTEENGFLSECCKAAKENSIHVLVGLDLRDTDGSEDGKSLNKVVWIDQSGEILGSYLKTMTIPFLEADYAHGSGVIPSHLIRVGDRDIKISYLICYDSNFPLFVRRMENDTDILFLPSWDWPAVTTQHSMLCRTLAVENRVSVIKPTYDGINLAVRPDGTVIDSFDINEVGYEQVRITDIPIRNEGHYVAGLTEKDNYVYSIIAVEILSILICLVLLYGSFFENHESTPRNRFYSWSVIACLLALSADAVSWIFDGCVRLEPVLYASTVISLVMTFVIDGVFIYYITEYIHERRPVSYVIPRIFMALSIVMIILTVAVAGSGALFTFENGVYQEGPLYSIYVIINLICSVFCLGSNMINMRFMSMHDRIATLSYILLPWLAGFINLFDETFSYAYPAIVLSLVVLYVMIQSERQDKLEMEGIASNQRARHDALTNLLNRIAYEERLQELSCAEGTAAAVFTDVNGLKYTNDKFGHEAGDNLLIRYAELICRHFRKEDIFRISGDEFTILLENIDEETVETRLKKFCADICTDGFPLASVGLAYGNGNDINELIKIAEAEMYSEKEEFHRNHPEIARR